MRPDLAPADVGRRILGYVIDLVIVVIAYVAVVMIATIAIAISLAFVIDAGDYPDLEQGIDALTTTLGYGTIPLYYVGMWAWRGQTLAQMLMGIHVVPRRAPALGDLSFGTALARFVGYGVCWIVPFHVGFLLGWHDKIAGTEAVLVRRMADTPHSPPWPPLAPLATPPPGFVPPPAPQQPRRYCRHCGAALGDAAARFCGQCGGALGL